MKLKSMGVVVMLVLFAVGATNPAIAREAPVAKLVQVEGDVAYSRSGDNWRPVRRTKYLFSGYQIKTGKDGSGKLINQETGLSQELGANTIVQVEDQGVSVVEGSLSKPKEESVSIFESLANKFAKAQRYTTVRRSYTSGDEQACDNKVRTIRTVTLSKSHPDLVWRNACPEYSYRLVIDGKAVEIPAQSTSEMIRYTVSGLKPGEYTYHVEVLDKDGTVYIPRSKSTLVWISDAEEAKINKELAGIEEDVFLETSVLEAHNMYVAAMDAYREYFQEYPDDHEMRPLLIQSYQDLKLDNLRENEARLYNAALADGP
ncbi:MAG: hypothetical protein ACFHX7_05680 [Pseudomonadota bacterium]